MVSLFLPLFLFFGKGGPFCKAEGKGRKVFFSQALYDFFDVSGFSGF